jgi:hypothetical protein
MKVGLTAPSFLGDEVVFTGVVREIRLCTGFDISVSTSRPSLWLGNEVSVGHSGDEDLIISDHLCPPFRDAAGMPLHFLERYFRRVHNALGDNPDHQIKNFSGDIRVTEDDALNPIGERYWVINSGYKSGVITKGWPHHYYSEVVEALSGRIAFVQIGDKSAMNMPIPRAINLVDKTNIRELIRLIHHSEGVLCPITSTMHMAAAVPIHESVGFGIRPCVVVAGGRESVPFINYPSHVVLNTIGTLSCCLSGGCGKNTFGPGQCLRPEVVNQLCTVPKCMASIKPRDVISSIEAFYRNDVILPRQVIRATVLAKRLDNSFGNISIKGVEVGVLKGEMSASLLRQRRNLTLLMVDRWTNDPSNKSDPKFYSRDNSYFESSMRAAIASTDFASDRRTIIKESSLKAASTVEDDSLDFVFIDADHGYEECLSDIRAWFPKLRSNGIMCGHDYHRPNYPEEGVKRAVDEFLMGSGMRLETDRDNTWFLYRN